MIKLENLTKHYKDFTLSCSLSVPAGYITGMVGPNGAGKSTTFKAILGLVRPDGGTVKVFGKNPLQLSPEEKAQIGVTLSDSGFCGALTASNAASIMAKMYPGFDSRDFLQRCREYGIPADKPVNSFSSGMKGKLKLLTALSHPARLLILDEPTAGLDVLMREQIADLLREWMEKGNRSILISSHIASDLEGLCDDIYLIHQGRILLHEETGRLLDEYGRLKLTADQYAALDKRYILRVKETGYGCDCLTQNRGFYEQNYPELIIEKGSIDDVLSLSVGGKTL